MNQENIGHISLFQEDFKFTFWPHPIIYLFLIWYICGFLIINIILYTLKDFIQQVIWIQIFWMFISIFYIFFIIILFVLYLNYSIKYLRITNDKIILISQKNFFKKEYIEIPFSKIQETKISITWILAHIFKYGTYSIHSNTEKYNFYYFKNPQENAKIINQFINKNIL